MGLGDRGERPATETLGDEFGDPQPICLSTGFRDKAVNLKGRVWIDNPQNGIGSIKSDRLFAVNPDPVQQ